MPVQPSEYAYRREFSRCWYATRIAWPLSDTRADRCRPDGRPTSLGGLTISGRLHRHQRLSRVAVDHQAPGMTLAFARNHGGGIEEAGFAAAHDDDLRAAIHLDIGRCRHRHVADHHRGQRTPRAWRSGRINCDFLHRRGLLHHLLRRLARRRHRNRGEQRPEFEVSGSNSHVDPAVVWAVVWLKAPARPPSRLGSSLPSYNRT